MTFSTTVKEHLELPTKLGAAFTATEILGHFLSEAPENYEAMLSLANIGSTELKVLTNAIIMNIPHWARLFRDQNKPASYWDTIKAFAINTSKGVFAFNIQSIMGTVIRFSLPPQWQLEFFLHLVNGYMIATVLDHLNDKKIPLIPYFQIIAMLAFKQSASTIDAALLPLLTSYLDIDENVLAALTHILSDVILPPVAGAATGFGAHTVTKIGNSIKECALSFWNKHNENSNNDEESSINNKDGTYWASMSNMASYNSGKM